MGSINNLLTSGMTSVFVSGGLVRHRLFQKGMRNREPFWIFEGFIIGFGGFKNGTVV